MEKIYMPKLSSCMEEGIIISWLKEQGEQVKKGEPVFEIETDKVVCEVEATADGILSEMCFEEGSYARVGAVVAVIEQQYAGKGK